MFSIAVAERSSYNVADETVVKYVKMERETTRTKIEKEGLGDHTLRRRL